MKLPINQELDPGLMNFLFSRESVLLTVYIAIDPIYIDEEFVVGGWVKVVTYQPVTLHILHVYHLDP